jgi:hypothetical protein
MKSMKGVLTYPGSTIPEDAATLEHIYPRNDIRRYAHAGACKKFWTVCACYECNIKRDNQQKTKIYSYKKRAEAEIFDIRILVDPFYVSKTHLFHFVFDPFTGIM